jgi:hypothetical protein
MREEIKFFMEHGLDAAKDCNLYDLISDIKNIGVKSAFLKEKEKEEFKKEWIEWKEKILDELIKTCKCRTPI